MSKSELLWDQCAGQTLDAEFAFVLQANCCLHSMANCFRKLGHMQRTSESDKFRTTYHAQTGRADLMRTSPPERSSTVKIIKIQGVSGQNHAIPLVECLGVACAGCRTWQPKHLGFSMAAQPASCGKEGNATPEWSPAEQAQ